MVQQLQIRMGLLDEAEWADWSDEQYSEYCANIRNAANTIPDNRVDDFHHYVKRLYGCWLRETDRVGFLSEGEAKRGH
mgnify:CR=1 FL=1